MKAKVCGLGHLPTVKAVIKMYKSTVPIFIISKVATLWYKQIFEKGDLI